MTDFIYKLPGFEILEEHLKMKNPEVLVLWVVVKQNQRG